jgi:hypothetical protein
VDLALFSFALRQQLQQFSFVPAKRNGAPAAIRTHVTRSYTLEERSDEYAMGVAADEVGPKQVVFDLPKPPVGPMTMNDGWVRVGFTVGRDGKPRDVGASILKPSTAYPSRPTYEWISPSPSKVQPSSCPLSGRHHGACTRHRTAGLQVGGYGNGSIRPRADH